MYVQSDDELMSVAIWIGGRFFQSLGQVLPEIIIDRAPLTHSIVNIFNRFLLPFFKLKKKIFQMLTLELHSMVSQCKMVRNELSLSISSKNPLLKPLIFEFIKWAPLDFKVDNDSTFITVPKRDNILPLESYYQYILTSY